MRNVSNESCRENQTIQVMFNNSFLIMPNVEEYVRTRQGTDDNMAHAHCMLDTHGYRQTQSEYIIT